MIPNTPDRLPAAPSRPVPVRTLHGLAQTALRLARQLARLRPARLAAVAATVLMGTAHAAEPWPDKPVQFIVPFPPGGVTDIVGRLYANELARLLGQPFIVDNRGGAGGNIGTRTAAEAAPDGYTVLLGTVGTHAINPTLYGNLPYDPAKAFTPVAMMLAGPNVLVVHPDVPARSVAELTALAKSKPGALNMGSSGSGSSIHLSGEMYKHLAGVDITHVPYRGGGPALTDLVGGRLDLMFDNLSTSLPMIKDGRLRALAVTGPQRIPSLPDVPTMQEAGVAGYEAVAWMGLFVPTGTPAGIVERLNAATIEAQKSPGLSARLAELGAEPNTLSAAAFADFVDAETRRWPDVVRASGAKAE